MQTVFGQSHTNLWSGQELEPVTQDPFAKTGAICSPLSFHIGPTDQGTAPAGARYPGLQPGNG